jgi:polar amino acid transport system substrate-binding protein
MRRWTQAVLFALLFAGCATVPPVKPATAIRPTGTPFPRPTATATAPPTVRPPLKVIAATDAGWPPFEYVDETTKEIVGFDIDLMKAIAVKSNLNVEFVNVAWEPLLEGIAQCQYDAAISFIPIAEDRKPDMLFSDSYYTVGQQIVAAAGNADVRNPGDLRGKRVGAQISTVSAIEVGKMEGAELVMFNAVNQAFRALLTGDVDAVVADNILALGYVGKYPEQLKTVGEPFAGESIAIAVCKHKPELLEKINAGLQTVLDQGIIDGLNDKWVKTMDPEEG